MESLLCNQLIMRSLASYVSFLDLLPYLYNGNKDTYFIELIQGLNEMDTSYKISALLMSDVVIN